MAMLFTRAGWARNRAGPASFDRWNRAARRVEQGRPLRLLHSSRLVDNGVDVSLVAAPDELSIFRGDENDRGYIIALSDSASSASATTGGSSIAGSACRGW
jgi:hypothetical protein